MTDKEFRKLKKSELIDMVYKMKEKVEELRKENVELNDQLDQLLIGLPGDKIDIDDQGRVTVNGEELDEPYVSELQKGACEITFPYQVPESRFFVMGDNRGVSIDSRSVTLGCIYDEGVIGKVLLRVYPFHVFGMV